MQSKKNGKGKSKKTEKNLKLSAPKVNKNLNLSGDITITEKSSQNVETKNYKENELNQSELSEEE